MLREKRVRGKRDSVCCGKTMKNEEKEKRASERIPDQREEEERKKKQVPQGEPKR